MLLIGLRIALGLRLGYRLELVLGLDFWSGVSKCRAILRVSVRSILTIKNWSKVNISSRLRVEVRFRTGDSAQT